MDSDQSCPRQNTRGDDHQGNFFLDKIVTIVDFVHIGDCLCLVILTFDVSPKNCVSISRSHLESCLWTTPMGWVWPSIIFCFNLRFLLSRVCIVHICWAQELSNQIKDKRGKDFCLIWEVDIYENWLRSEFDQTTLCQLVSSGFDHGSAGEPPLKLFTQSSSLILASRPLRWNTC